MNSSNRVGFPNGALDAAAIKTAVAEIMWTRIQMNSRDSDNPKIGQRRTILRQWNASANQTIQATSAVLTWGLEGDAPLGGWNNDG